MPTSYRIDVLPRAERADVVVQSIVEVLDTHCPDGVDGAEQSQDVIDCAKYSIYVHRDLKKHLVFAGW